MTGTDRVRLSIGIPTYNFGSTIGATLESIVAQLRPGVEIVVLDGGSSDDTPTIMEAWRGRCPSIHYHRQPAPGGIDRDMARVIALSRGAYFWLFSADDIMAAGALDMVLEHLPGGADVLLLTHSDCTYDMRVIFERHPVLAGGDARFALSDAGSRERYFSLALTSEAFFSFMSGLVVKRATWFSIPESERYFGSCWAHAARLLEILRDQGLVIDYLAKVALHRRGDNDSFLKKGVVHRWAIAIEGYQGIAETLFGRDSVEARHVRRILRNEFRMRDMLHLKLKCRRAPASESFAHLDRLIQSIYRDGVADRLKWLIFRTAPAWAFATGLVVIPPVKKFLRRMRSS